MSVLQVLSPFEVGAATNAGASGIALVNDAVTFLRLIFDPQDRVCIAAKKTDNKNFRTDFQTCDAICTEEYQNDKLAVMNDTDHNIYVCMNTIAAGQSRRRKLDIGEIRSVYLDLDTNGRAKLDIILASKDVPEPTIILESSPGKFQVIWSIRGINKEQQEALLSALIHRFGGDPAASDCSRVLRLPGFVNCKYQDGPLVTLISSSPSQYKLEDFCVSTADVAPKAPIDLSPNGAKIPYGQHDNELHRCAGLMRHNGMEEESIYAALVEICEKRCENYGSDYLEMCRKHSRAICQKSIGKDDRVFIDGVPAGTAKPQTQAVRDERRAAEVKEVLDSLPRPSSPVIAKIEDMPEDCVVGVLGDACLERMSAFPRAYSWLTLVTHAAQFVPSSGPTSWRQNLYFAPVGVVHGGKSVAGTYARGLLAMDEDALPMVNVMPGSAEGLMKKLANANGQSRLVNVDELGFLLERASLEGASFPFILDRSYYQKAYALTTQNGKEVTFNCSLSLIGGVTLLKEGAYEQFGDLFGRQSIGGMYDRFLFGLAPSGWEYDYLPFSGPSLGIDVTKLKPVTIGTDVWEAKNAWVKQYKLNPRRTESCIRVVGNCASYDGRTVLHPQDIEKPVIALAKYQTQLELLLKPNPGQNDDGRLSNKLMGYLRRHSPNGEWLSERDMLRDTNAYDYGVRAEKVLNSLEYNGEIERSMTSATTGGRAKRVVRLAAQEDPTQ